MVIATVFFHVLVSLVVKAPVVVGSLACRALARGLDRTVRVPLVCLFVAIRPIIAVILVEILDRVDETWLLFDRLCQGLGGNK